MDTPTWTADVNNPAAHTQAATIIEPSEDRDGD
jgi:hypothetical protein